MEKTLSNAFPYKVSQAVSGLVSPGPALCNGTVTAVDKPDANGYRWVHVSYGKDETRKYQVSRSGTSDYLSPRPMRPTVNDDRVTINEAYTVESTDDGHFVAGFDSDELGTFETEAEGWVRALRHDWEAREAARLAKLDPTGVVIGCLWSEHLTPALNAAKQGPEALERLAREKLEKPPSWAGYATESAARDMRALGFEGVDWSKVVEHFAR